HHSPPSPHPLSLPDALPILARVHDPPRPAADVDDGPPRFLPPRRRPDRGADSSPKPTTRFDADRAAAADPRDGLERRRQPAGTRDRKSTRLNSSHDQISYAV